MELCTRIYLCLREPGSRTDIDVYIHCFFNCNLAPVSHVGVVLTRQFIYEVPWEQYIPLSNPLLTSRRQNRNLISLWLNSTVGERKKLRTDNQKQFKLEDNKKSSFRNNYRYYAIFESLGEVVAGGIVVQLLPSSEISLYVSELACFAVETFF